MNRRTALSLLATVCLSGCERKPPEAPQASAQKTIASTPSTARTPDGHYISWKEHLIDDESTNGGTPIRGADGLVVHDVDRDGWMDIVSVHEDSAHLRIAFGSEHPDEWESITVASGDTVGAIEDVAVGDLNGDGWPDLVVACEEAHLTYFQNPGPESRSQPWAALIPPITQGRGSWLRVFLADLNDDGRLDVLGANKGSADIIDPSLENAERPTSVFYVHGDPLAAESWHEQVLSLEVVPNTAMPVDIDNDGDMDVLVAARLRLEMSILESVGVGADGEVEMRSHAIRISPGFDAGKDWQGKSNAFQSVFVDLDRDGRKDLVVAVYELPQSRGTPLMAGLGWLRQPEALDQPWLYHQIGNTLPDIVAGIAIADINGDGHPDAVTGGYSGLNVLKGGYSGATRETDDPQVTAASTTGRIAWFENPGDPTLTWERHDISRRVRGMYDGFVPFDLDGDGDVDLISTRGNSGPLDGVFWLEQIRSDRPQVAFIPARSDDSRSLPLPPPDWADHYEEEVVYVAPNKR